MIGIKALKNEFNGDPCIVMGTGPSIGAVLNRPKIDRFTTIGVNDISRYYMPTYLVVTDNFIDSNEYNVKINRIRATSATAVFDHQRRSWPNIAHTIYYDFEALHTHDPAAIFTRDHIPASQTTTEIAIGIAVYLGFQRIGVIGFDLFGHPCEKHADKINQDMAKLAVYAESNNQFIYNLSQDTLVDAFPTLLIDEYIDRYGGA